MCLSPDSEGVAPLKREKPHSAGQSTLLQECSLLVPCGRESVWQGLPLWGLLEQACQSRALRGNMDPPSWGGEAARKLGEKGSPPLHSTTSFHIIHTDNLIWHRESPASPQPNTATQVALQDGCREWNHSPEKLLSEDTAREGHWQHKLHHLRSLSRPVFATGGPPGLGVCLLFLNQCLCTVSRSPTWVNRFPQHREMQRGLLTRPGGVPYSVSSPWTPNVSEACARSTHMWRESTAHLQMSGRQCYPVSIHMQGSQGWGVGGEAVLNKRDSFLPGRRVQPQKRLGREVINSPSSGVKKCPCRSESQTSSAFRKGSQSQVCGWLDSNRISLVSVGLRVGQQHVLSHHAETDVILFFF